MAFLFIILFNLFSTSPHLVDIIQEGRMINHLEKPYEVVVDSIPKNRLKPDLAIQQIIDQHKSDTTISSMSCSLMQESSKQYRPRWAIKGVFGAIGKRWRSIQNLVGSFPI